MTASTDYGVSIVESFVPPKQWVPGQTINKDVYAVNTGNIEAFVKESISGNLSYTYEKRVATAPANGTDASGKARDAGYVRLDTDSARAIDGATTMEAGGFIAWAAPVNTVYKLNGKEVKEGTTDGTITTPAVANQKSVVVGTAAAKKFKYEYTDTTGTYVGDSLEEGAVFYKLTDPASAGDPYTASATDAGNLTLTVDHSPTAGTVNSATQTDANDAANAPGKVEGERWHPTDTGVYIFRRSYVPNNAADADKNAVTYKFNGTEVEESAFKTNTTADKWEVTDDSDSSTKTFKYKYTDGSSNVYYGDDLKNDTVFYKADANGKINSSVVADQVKLVRNQEGYFTYAGYYYVADDTDPVKNEGKYYKIVLGNDDFRAIETDGTGTDKTYIFDVSATQYQLGYPDTIEVDPVTGKIASDSKVAYSFVKEEKVENVTPDLYYHATGGGASGDVAYLQAVYSAKDADGTGNYAQKAAIASAAAEAADKARHDYLDAQGKQAAAEATYENAAGEYNSKKSRYDQAAADWEYAKALSEASKKLSNAAKDRAAVQTKVDNASDALNDAWNGLKNIASDMHGTLPAGDTTANTPSTAANKDRVFTDLLKFKDGDVVANRTNISYKSLFETALPSNLPAGTATLKSIIESEAAQPVNGTMANYNNTDYYLLSNAHDYMTAMETLWDDSASHSGTATDASIVGASKRLEQALAEFANIDIAANESADAVAQAKLDELKAARDNMESLLEDYKALFQSLNTTNFTEGTLTALLSGTDDFTTQIQAWITRLDEMETYIADNKNPAKAAGELTYDNEGTTNARVHEEIGDSRGIDIVTQDFKKKYQDYYNANTTELPQAKANWEQALKDYNKAVNNTDGAGKTYHDAIYTEQKKVDEYHSGKLDNGSIDPTKVVYQKNDYEGLTSDGTATAAADSDHWYLKDNKNDLVGWYAIQRPTNGDPSITIYDGSNNFTGENLWKTIGSNEAALPTGTAGTDRAAGNSGYYPDKNESNDADITKTYAATYDDAANGTNAYTRSYVGVAETDDTKFHTLVADKESKFPTVSALEAAYKAVDVTTPETAYANAIATTAAAKKDSERAATVSAGAQDAANAAMAADESAIKINILLDDAAENLDWTSALADGAHAQVADFYYNYILGAGETSEKLIDAVELDKSLTARDYKELVFDLNVKLDSAQVTYDNDQRTITTTAVEANDEFKMNPTVGRESTDGKGVAVTWDGSKSVSPTTTYRVGTNPVTPTKVTAKTVSGKTGAEEYLNGDYIYEIDVAGTKYYGKSLADGTKFYEFDGTDIKPDSSVTLNVVQ